MNNPFEKDFDTILEEILTDWRNQDPDVDLSKGSPNFIKAGCLASGLWGLHKSVAWVADQIFPDSSDYDQLVAHAAKRQLLLTGTPAELLARVMADIRTPPSGGNRHDYVRWAEQASPLVKKALCVPLGQGPGTLDLVVLADAAETGSEIPTEELLATVRAFITEKAPNDVKYLRVLAPELLPQDVTITRMDATEPAETAEANISNYMNGLLPGQTLYPGQLITLSLGGGPGDVSALDPAAAVVPTVYQMIRPGVVSVA